MRKTSIETYRAIRDEGLLSKLRFIVYDCIYKHGPITISEMIRMVSNKVTNTGSFTGRISELKEMGLIYEHHEGECPITGRNVIFWETTDNLPAKLEKKTVAPRWIKHQPEKLVYDGSRWAVALQVHNKETGKTNWEIDTVAVSCDEESFSLTALCDGESADPYSSWSWEDFEFVFPMNSEARMTIKEWGKE